MKDQTFGVEIEMNNIRRDTAAKIAAKYFGTNHYEDTRYTNGYFTWSAWDQQGREWKFQRDGSIAGPDAEKCEVVTPILHYNDIEMMQELVRRLRAAGAKSNPRRGCGIHVHIGAAGQTPESIRNLANIMASHEDLLTKALKLDSGRIYHFCKPVNKGFLDALNAQKPETMTDLADVWYRSQPCCGDRNAHYNTSRYHMLNLHAMFTKGTIEFRLFQFDNPGTTLDGRRYYGGIHAGQLKSYVQLCLALCARAKGNIDDAQVVGDDKYVMCKWLDQLGLTGNEFKTARDIFTRNLVGNVCEEVA